MKPIIFSIIMIASFAAVAPADAKKKTTPTDPYYSNSPRTQYFKQFGAHYAPRERKWILSVSDNALMSVQDALRKCISEKTGIPVKQIPIGQLYNYR